MGELELITAIIASNPSINIDDAWKMYRDLVTRAHALNTKLKVGEAVALPESVSQEKGAEAPKPEKESLAIGYSRRSLKVKPQDAIQKDSVFCCICGKSMHSINARHLSAHNGLTREGYLKLCGYPANQVLMSLNHLKKMQAQVTKAQKARKQNKKYKINLQ
jgi:predicted transcriptional regulator